MQKINHWATDEKTVVVHTCCPETTKEILRISKIDPSIQFSFDDGLYSQYFYLDKYQDIPNKKVFYISTNFINKDTIQELDTDSAEAQDAALESPDGLRYFMTAEDIKKISSAGCSIGMHGHKHLRLEDCSILEKKADTILMYNTFLKLFDGTEWSKNFTFPYDHWDDIYVASMEIQLKIRNTLHQPKIFKKENRVYIETLLGLDSTEIQNILQTKKID